MIKIDLDKCIKCKSCIRDCFPENIILQNDEISIKGPCMMCGHCVAICPTKAISFEGYEDSEELKDLNYNDELEKFKEPIWEGLNNFTNSDINSLVLKRYKDRFINMYENRFNDDKLFFKAPMLLVITSSSKINGILAADKIELMANMMGLGVLFSGFIEMAINHSEELIKKFRLKRNVTCACMLIGYPDISYKCTAPRKNINVDWL